MNGNAELAGATLAYLAGVGVKHVMVCAGARNAPLVTSLLVTRGTAGWRIWHHFDERTASFFALGLGKKSREPVAVITTSGTAVAELLPSAVEAYYAGVPLILVTADRPVVYRGSGAPQAIEQVGIFGSYAPLAIDVQGVSDLDGFRKWNRAEPVHLNLCFEEPSPDDLVSHWEPVELPLLKLESGHDDNQSIEAFVTNSKKLIVLLGELEAGWRLPVESFLAGIGVPVWAEATSGLRESERLAGQLIRMEGGVADLKPREILRIGGVPSLRFWRDLEGCGEIAVMSVSRRPFSGLARLSQLLLIDEFPCWNRGSNSIQISGDPLIEEGFKPAEQPPLKGFPDSEPAMIRAVSELIPEEALVYLGNSLPIREWNLAASFRPAHPQCFASRGANGIDGQVATFLGLSDAEEESWGIFGDLTALYDLNAPALFAQLTKARRRLVIMNNGGGKIFSRLPGLAGLDDASKAVTENHHEQGFKSWAEMWGLRHMTWKAGDPAPVLTDDDVLIEVILDNEATECFWQALK
ncbi:MAG: 2-succinyl-5-enolpyruvyl-6-hydroxy-3-cyclohexene-1-carboxylic-acid synthase [Verrucomicrobiales bacterium]|nr:2-succinyl-5-enolpyruvyl-6-hydroxy-3-cyclohexene-1-carboxylic-acid synthase [Verrucomicrobiales bacterium]